LGGQEPSFSDLKEIQNMTMKTMIPIPAGALLTITSGEYSSYFVSGVFRAVKTLDCDALKSAWIQLHPDQSEEYHFEESQFIAWVAIEGWLEPVDCFEWHIGNYRIEDMSVEKFGDGDLYEQILDARRAEQAERSKS
jgi:hypothetical protein